MKDIDKREILEKVKAGTAQGLTDKMTVTILIREGLVKKNGKAGMGEDQRVYGFELTPEGEKFLNKHI